MPSPMSSTSVTNQIYAINKKMLAMKKDLEKIKIENKRIMNKYTPKPKWT